MDFTSPLSGLMRPMDAAILTVLARTNDGFTGRRIEALIGTRSRSGLAASLDRLVSVGLIDRTDIGNAAVYRVNRDHVFWKPIFDVIMAAPAIIEGEIADILHGRYRENVTAALFGSVARRDSNIHSDLDIVVVFLADGDPDLRSRTLVKVADLVRRRSGTTAHLVDIDLRDLHRMVESSDPLIESWFDESRTILGTDLRTLIREVRES